MQTYARLRFINSVLWLEINFDMYSFYQQNIIFYKCFYIKSSVYTYNFLGKNKNLICSSEVLKILFFLSLFSTSRYPWASRVRKEQDKLSARDPGRSADRSRSRSWPRTRDDDVCKSIKRRRTEATGSVLIKAATGNRSVELSSNFVPASPAGDNERG